MPTMPHSARYGDVRCAHCEHFDEDGCEQAAEALLAEGWPRAAVLVDEAADADRCPEFAPSADYSLGRDEEDSAREACARLTAIAHFKSW